MKMISDIRFAEKHVQTGFFTHKLMKVLQVRTADSDEPFTEPSEWQDVPAIDLSNDEKSK